VKKKAGRWQRTVKERRRTWSTVGRGKKGDLTKIKTHVRSGGSRGEARLKVDSATHSDGEKSIIRETDRGVGFVQKKKLKKGKAPRCSLSLRGIVFFQKKK